MSEFFRQNWDWSTALLIAAFIIALLLRYTYKQTRRQNTQNNGGAEIYRNTDPGSLLASRKYNRLQSLFHRKYREANADNGDEYEHRLTSLLLWWTSALASAGILGGIFAAFTLFAIRGQLSEMRIDSAIHMAELAPKMLYEIDRDLQFDGWHITARWGNHGKTDALHYSGWDELYFFKRMVTESDLVKPIDTTKYMGGEEGETIIPDAQMSFTTKIITMQDAWDAAYHKGAFVTWGYVKYMDIFGSAYTVRHCELLQFTIEQNAIHLHLPNLLFSGCNKRTTEKKAD